ncbi:hypothetical protein A8C56_09500 [Niabella ginsenosidivorans]|uniref:NERD domain-containing protein n=1 Tax=Niabella ginsenosidivorans TaxID=1176587 RepID=A0A1A9I1H1_9BACT|nr:hypothetical protein [Niabella ginsenosidivorans]ANH81185.1 hypothetical protein A8C56_09500 [Niabella ginsenosidivorans]
MPRSRTRKKKRISTKTKSSHNQTSAKNIAPGVAPDPIKMKYFEASFNEGATETTFEDRLAVIKEIGRKATVEFPAKFKAIQNWFKNYDQLQLLSFSMYYFMTSFSGYDEEAVTGTLDFPPYYQELLQAFSLTLPRTYYQQPFSSEVEKFKSDIKTACELNKYKYYAFFENVENPDEIPFHLLRMEMMINTTAVRNWSYKHKMESVTLDLAHAIRDSFIDHHGFDPVVFLKLIYKMADVVEERINVHMRKTAEVINQKNYIKMMEAYECQFPVGKTTPEQREEIWKKFGKKLQQLKGMFLMHSDIYLDEIFTFDFKTLEDYSNGLIASEKLKYIFGEISLQFGQLADHNEEYFLLNNPVHEKPFILIDSNSVFSSLWTIMTHLSISLLENFCAGDEQLRKKHNDSRAFYLEEQVALLFKESFPMAQIFRGSKWKGDDGKEYENDLLVIVDKFALVVEAKAGLVSAPAKRGAPERLFKTLQELIEEPSEQALRFIEFLKDNPAELSLKVKKGPNNKFNASSLKYFIPLGVTLSHLGMLSSNLKQLIRAGVTDKPIEKLAPSISLTDLQVVFDLLPLAAEKIHYLQRRREMEASVEYIGDELDLLAWYLDDGFNLGSDMKKYDFFKMDLKAKELDNYIIGAANKEPVVKPQLLKTQWWKDILYRLEEKKPQPWLEVSYILLNASIDIQKQFEIFINEMKNKMLKGIAEHPHNWILLETAEEDRQFVIAGYGYHNHLRKDRDDIIYDILDDKKANDAKGVVVIGMNVDKNHYPYSILGCRLAPELFDNRHLAMLKPGANQEPENLEKGPKFT